MKTCILNNRSSFSTCMSEDRHSPDSDLRHYNTFSRCFCPKRLRIVIQMERAKNTKQSREGEKTGEIGRYTNSWSLESSLTFSWLKASILLMAVSKAVMDSRNAWSCSHSGLLSRSAEIFTAALDIAETHKQTKWRIPLNWCWIAMERNKNWSPQKWISPGYSVNSKIHVFKNVLTLSY